MWISSCSSSLAAQLRGEGLRVAGDRGRVLGGRAVAQRERVHQRGEHSELQRGELDRAGFQLVGALLGAQQRDREVVEDEQHEHARE